MISSCHPLMAGCWYPYGFQWTGMQPMLHKTQLELAQTQRRSHCSPQDGLLKRLIQSLRLSPPLEIFSHNLHESTDYRSTTSHWQYLPIPCLSKIIHKHIYLTQLTFLPDFRYLLKPQRTLIKQFVKHKSLPHVQTISTPCFGFWLLSRPCFCSKRTTLLSQHK